MPEIEEVRIVTFSAQATAIANQTLTTLEQTS
jgi:hypothetical protein